ncbi:MAG: hypothetical protein OXN89_11960 [Bryobacterales bacterium]|nr:hypothetical protein [Bryobacterales bacterium]
MGGVAVGPQRGMLRRLDLAFKSFFKRVKAGKTPGFPRFKPLSRCVTIDATIVGSRMIRKQGSRCVIRIKGFPRIECSPSGGARRPSLEVPAAHPLRQAMGSVDGL